MTDKKLTAAQIAATTSETEARARILLNQITEQEHCDNVEIALFHTFKAKWESALPVVRIHAIACAMTDLAFTIGDIQGGLTKLVKMKVLRSHVVSGRRFYEVNY